MANYSDQTNPGQFIATTQIYDLDQTKVSAEDFTVRLRQNFNNLIMTLNVKVSGYYSQEEFVNGKLFYPDYTRVNSRTSAPPTFRQVFSKTIDFDGLPGGGPYPQTKTIAHGISGYPVAGATDFIFTDITGCAADQTNRNALKLPYSSPVALADNIAVDIVGPNIVITVGNDRSAYNRAYLTVEFLKF